MSNLPFLFDIYEGGSGDSKTGADMDILPPDMIKLSQEDYSGTPCQTDYPDEQTLRQDISYIIKTFDHNIITHKLIKKMLEHKYKCSFNKAVIKGLANEIFTSHLEAKPEPEARPGQEVGPEPERREKTKPKVSTGAVGAVGAVGEVGQTCNRQSIEDKITIPNFDIGQELTPRIRLPYWVLPNKKYFTSFLNNQFTKGYLNSSLTKRGDISVKSHQRFVSEFIQSDSPYRGILLYHGLGSGKTAASLFIADGIPDKQMIIMLPASIEENYRGEIRKYSSIRDISQDDDIEHNWCYYPLPEVDTPNDIEKYKDLLYGNLGLDVSQKLLQLILVDRGIRYSERSKKWQIVYRDPAKQKYKVITSFSTKQEAEENYRILTEAKNITSSRFGIWLVNQGGRPNFADFEELDQKEILETINKVYQYKYNFIRYNAGRALLKNNSGTGLFDLLDNEDQEKIRQQFNINFSRSDSWHNIKIDKSNWAFITSLIQGGMVTNPFSNKVVVVDEIHNFVSKIVGGGYTCKALYILMMTCKNTKFVFLSGTPAINDPFELGVLFNMLRGNTVTYPFQLANNTPANRDKTAAIFNNMPSIDYYSVEDMGKIYYTLNPYNFINIYDSNGNRLGVAKAQRVVMEIEIVGLQTLNSNPNIRELVTLLEGQGNRIIIPTLKHQPLPSSSLVDGLTALIQKIFTLLDINLDVTNNIINVVISRENQDDQIKLTFTFHNIPDETINSHVEQLVELVKQLFKVQQDDLQIKPPTNEYMEPFYNNTSNETFAKNKIEHKLNKEQIKVLDLKNESYMGPFPCFSRVRKINEELDLAKKDFANSYIDFSDQSVKNKENFKINILGLVSYFRETTETDQYNNSIFPDNLLPHYETGDEITSSWDLTGIRLVNSIMSNYQFIKYSEARDIEREMEFSKSDRGNIQANFTIEQQLNALSQNQEKTSSYFKVMSRNCLLFVFPPELEREWPRDIKARLKTQQNMMEAVYGKEHDGDDDDDIEAEEEGDSKKKESPKTEAELEKLETYNEMKGRILDKLTPDNLTVNSSPYNLSVLSPKYVDIFNNLQVSPGLIMCYSQFRTVEGIEVFKRVLEAYGYSPCPIGDQGIKPLELGKMMTRVCLYREATPRQPVADKDPHREQVWITAFPGAERHPKLNNFVSYSTKIVRDTLAQSLAFNGKTENVGDKTSFVPTRTEAQITLKIDEIIRDHQEKLQDRLRKEYPESDPDPINPEKIWVEEIENQGTENEQRNIFPAQYGIFTKKDGKKILEVQQSENNKYGQQMQILFITLAGAEGLSLKNIRMVHIMEPFWNMVKINQVIGRARRNYSHQTLPIDQRNVRIYEYIGTFSDSQLSGTWSSHISYNEILSSEKIQTESEENLKRYVLEKARKYTVDVTNIDNNITSDQFLLEISKRKDKIMSGFLALIKESAIDCLLNKAVNRQGDPFAAEMECENSNRFPANVPLGSNTQFIRIPGKTLQGVVLESTSDLPTGKHLLTFPINNQFGNFKISAILNGDQGVLYDLYYYYGLDPSLKGPTHVYKPIGTASNQEGDIVITIKDSFLKESSLPLLERYNEIDKVRKQLEEIPNSEFIGLPKSPKIALAWINAIRNAPQLAKYREEPEAEEKPSEKAMTPYDVLGVSESISQKELTQLASAPDLSPEKKKAIAQIIKERRGQRKK